MTGRFIWKIFCNPLPGWRSYTYRMTLDQFRDNSLVFDAVFRHLEIIGKVAKQLPDEAKAMMPDIEWSKAAAS